MLTDQEIDKIIKFNEDPILVEAVRKVMLKGIYSQGTLRKGQMADPLNNAALMLAFATVRGNTVSDADLGADIRGFAHGINLLESGFQELSKVEREVEEPESKENPAI